MALVSLQCVVPLLPPSYQAKLVLDAILSVKTKVIELIPKFKTLAEEVTELVKKTEEVFSEPTDKIKAAFGDSDDPFAIPKAVAAATGNAKTAAIEPIKIIKTFAGTMIRLNDEFMAAVSEVKALFATL